MQNISMEVQRRNCARVLCTIASPKLLNELFGFSSTLIIYFSDKNCTATEIIHKHYFSFYLFFNSCQNLGGGRAIEFLIPPSPGSNYPAELKQRAVLGTGVKEEP
jgi:hypothetical protein